MIYKYDIGQLVSSSKPAKLTTPDFGVIINKYIDADGKTNRYMILWQKDKQITGPYEEEEIQVYVSFYNLWDLKYVEDN